MQLVTHHIQLCLGYFIQQVYNVSTKNKIKNKKNNNKKTKHYSKSISICVYEFTFSTLPPETPFWALFANWALSCSLTKTAKETAWSRIKEFAGGHWLIWNGQIISTTDVVNIIVKQLMPMLPWNTVFPRVVMSQRGVRRY